jgi:hypothetical protein
MTPTPLRRALVVVMVVALVAVAAFADRAGRPHLARPARLVGADGPAVPPAAALSTSWLCPGGPATGQPVFTDIVVANAGDQPATGTVTVFSETAKPVTTALTVAPASTKTIDVSGMAGNRDWAAALIDTQGGRLAAEQYVAGPSGSTAKDAGLSLALFNPFPDDALVDLDFATTDGYRTPGDFQGIVVSAGTVRVIDVGAHVRREDAVSTEVRVRAGRLAAGQFFTRSAPGAAGVSLTLGQPSLGTSYFFPDGMVNPGVVERYELFNPGNAEAQVEIAFALEHDDIDPFDLTVPPQGRVVLAVNGEGRVPKGDAHSAVVTATNGVPIAVTRVFEVATGAGPDARSGRADTVGATTTARRWLFAMGAANGTMDEWVVVENPNDRPATVSVTALDEGRRLPVEGLQNVTVPARRRMALRLGDHIKRDALSLEVSADEPVVVERSLYSVGALGLAASLGLPFD